MELCDCLGRVTRLKGYELSIRRTPRGPRVYVSENDVSRLTESTHVIQFGRLTMDGDLEVEKNYGSIRVEGDDWKLILWPEYEEE